MNASTQALAYIIEDSLPLATIYAQMLEKMDFKAEVFATGNDGLHAINEIEPDLLLIDMQLPDMHGTEILQRLQSREVGFPRIAVTGHGSVETAVDAMRLGAVDFLEKPFTAERLEITIDNAMERVQLRKEVKVIREQIERDGYAGFVGRSLAMQVVYRIIENAASSRASVFITGESGTGKELCAQAIHEQSDRANGEFVAINCGAIPRELFESEIFGHVKGAFSGATSDRQGAAERAHGGTLFLDEIGEMNLDQQVKLLRLIQTGTFQRVGGNKTLKADIRFVCATNRDPIAMIEGGLFREDLYYRLNVIPIHMPALRERENDVLDIARNFLERISKEEGRQFHTFSPEVEEQFLQHDWPGNVRELQNVVHKAVLLNEGETLSPDMISGLKGTARPNAAAPKQLHTQTAQPPAVTQYSAPPQKHPEAAVEPLWLVEKRAIEQSIEHFGGNIPLAAAHLGVSASTIYRKIKSWQEQTAKA